MGSVYVCDDLPAPVDPAACTAWTVTEYDPGLFSLSLADAQALAVPILALWALAWVFRQCARLINQL